MIPEQRLITESSLITKSSLITEQSLIPEQSLISSEDQKADKERERYTSRSPLRSLLFFSIGPFCMTFFGTIRGVIETIYISKHYYDVDVYVAGASDYIKSILMVIMNSFVHGLIGKVSQLLAKNQKDESIRVIVDILRISFLIVIILSVAAVFLGKFLLKFLNTPSDLMDEAYHFLIPYLVSYPFETIVFTCNGILQAYGRSLAAGCVILCSFLLNTGILKPLFVFGFDFRFIYIGYSDFAAFSLLALILLILLIKGKFGFNFKFRMLIQGFSPETKYALLIGSPGLVASFASLFPRMLQFRYVLKAASKQNIQEIIGEILTVNGKLRGLIISFSMAISSSWFANGCFCFKAKLYSRLKKILLYAWLINFSYSAIWASVFIIRADFVAQIFINTPDFLSRAKQYLRIPGYTMTFTYSLGVFIQFFLVIDKQIIPILLPIFFGTVSSLSTIVLYRTKDDDSLRMMFAVTLAESVNCSFVLVLFLIFFIKMQRNVFRTETNKIKLENC